MLSALPPTPTSPNKRFRGRRESHTTREGWLNYPDSARACLPNTELPFKVGEGANWDTRSEAYSALGLVCWERTVNHGPGLPAGSGVMDLPICTGDAGSVPGPGMPCTPRSSEARGPQKLTPEATAREPQLLSPQAAQPLRPGPRESEPRSKEPTRLTATAASSPARVERALCSREDSARPEQI